MGAEIGVDRPPASLSAAGIVHESAGSGAPALMLIHGAFEDRTYFAPQVAHFARDRQVITLDLRGHGESNLCSQVTLDDFAADVIAVADAAGVSGAVLCGHSMAGVVALKVAAARPELVRGIVMLDGTVLFPEAARERGRTELVPALRTDHWLDALRGYFSRTLDPYDPSELSGRVMADLGRTRPEFAHAFFTDLFASDYADDLASSRCPLLYVHAKAPADLQRLSQLRPDAMVGQVVGSGHYLMLAVPDQVNAMIDRFLDVLAAPVPTS